MLHVCNVSQHSHKLVWCLLNLMYLSYDFMCFFHGFIYGIALILCWFYWILYGPYIDPYRALYRALYGPI